VAGGPESLIIDHLHARVLTDLWAGRTIAIQLKDHSTHERWPNSCEPHAGLRWMSSGIFFLPDARRQTRGAQQQYRPDSWTRVLGAGVDIIAHNSTLMHVYLPGAESATMAIIGITAQGSAAVLRTVRTAPGAHCVTADHNARVYICDPAKGRILVFSDSADVAATRPAEH
jgi:hypothetical protein